MKRLHVIYITGLGDHDPKGQRRAVGWWRLYGVEPEFCQMNWGDKEPWAPKFERLLALVDEAYSHDKKVCLVGVSAGASAAINAYAARKDKIAGVVLIAGKVNHPETVGNFYRRNNIAFVTSINDCQAALASLASEDRSRIQSRYAIYDERVHRQDNFIPGAHNRTVLGFGHFFTIASQIVFGLPSFLYFLRHQAKIK